MAQSSQNGVLSSLHTEWLLLRNEHEELQASSETLRKSVETSEPSEDVLEVLENERARLNLFSIELMGRALVLKRKIAPYGSSLNLNDFVVSHRLMLEAIMSRRFQKRFPNVGRGGATKVPECGGTY
jgi:hypothetical protein